MPTVAEIQARLDAINADMVKTREHLVRLDGAAQDCRYWLARATEEATQPQPTPPPEWTEVPL